VLRVAADFYLRLGDLREAEACLRKVIQVKARDPAEAAWARRMLAAVLAAAGDYQRSREALAVLGLLNDAPAAAAGSDDSGEEQRAKAVVLATQLEPAQQQEAIRILEALNQRQPLNEEDQFLLAQLYEKRGETAKFRQRMQRLLAAAPGTPRYTTYLAAYVRALLRHGELGEAELWLAKLEEQDRDGLGTLELQARVLAARGKGDEAVGLLTSRVPVREARLALALGNLLEEIGQGSAAEELYRKYVAEAKQPESSLVLARYLGRRNRLSEALALCDSAWQNCRAEEVGNACLEVLHAAPSGPEEKRRVERWLLAAHEKDPSQTGLLVCLADLQDLSGQYEAATRLYQQALAQDSHSVEALNNLAWLLAVREGKGETALGLVNQAIGVLGPIPELRDTRALAYLALGQLDKAQAELEQAVQLAPSPKVSAAIYFHLAEVQQRAGNEPAAKKAWQKAKEAGIETHPVHPLEEGAFHQLGNALTRR
jgi:tetratricopeptide (TPR) repeat protein